VLNSLVVAAVIMMSSLHCC